MVRRQFGPGPRARRPVRRSPGSRRNLPLDPPAPAELVRRLADRPPSRDLSLCHGEAGIGEALTALAAGPAGPAAAAALRRRATLILDVLQWQTRYCGTPDGVLTPGLLTGLSGIGYGLLRFGLPARIPSALLLEPDPRSAESADRAPTHPIEENEHV